jgi:hypothetical protein
MFKFLNVLFAICLLISCGDDIEEPVDTGFKRSGFFVGNQGSFGSGTGTVSFYDSEGDSLVSDIYQSANLSLPIGNILQSMTLIDDKVYLMVNNAAKIEIADHDNFMSVGSIQNLAQPRYMVSLGGDRAAVSQWGADGLSGAILLVDTENDVVLETRNLRNGPEKMILTDNKLYTCVSGGFGRDSVVMVLDPLDLSILDTIVVGDNPSSIVQDDSGILWVLGRGHSDFTDPTNNTQGFIISLDPSNNTLGDRISLPNGVSELTIDNDRDKLYYLTFGGYGAYDITGNSDPIVNTDGLANYYSLLYNDQTGNLLATDAKDFASNGDLVIIDPDNATIIKTETAGIIPFGFLINP